MTFCKGHTLDPVPSTTASADNNNAKPKLKAGELIMLLFLLLSLLSLLPILQKVVIALLISILLNTIHTATLASTTILFILLLIILTISGLMMLLSLGLDTPVSVKYVNDTSSDNDIIPGSNIA